MSRFESLPDDCRSKLKTDPRHTSGNELLPAEVAATMRNHDRPLWTASQMQAELETGHQRETVKKKLRKLDELGICASMEANNGRIYWWDDDRSDWPLPPDIVIDGQPDVTVGDLLAPWYAKVALLGLLGPTLAGIPLIIGVFQIGGTISLPIAGTDLLTAGLSMILLSYVALVYGGILGLVQWATSETVDMEFFDQS